MKVAVFGLGYVGCVTAAGFAARGHAVVGVDVNPTKIRAIQEGRTPVLEPGLEELIASTVAEGRLRATDDVEAAVSDSELSIVSVGTPSRSNGSIDTSALERVMQAIGGVLAGADRPHTVVVRSTLAPGTSERLLLPLLEEASGRPAGDGFGLAVNPEFLREGSSLADFHEPARTVIGQLDQASGDSVAALYEGFPGPVFRVPLGVGEMVKYVDNAFHALKVGFANEIGAACRAFGLDSHEVMEIFRADTKLNVSPAYLAPGFAFGGSCLPKDLRALVHAARRADLMLPILENVLPSNEQHLQRTVDRIMAVGRRRVGVFGLSFKAGTDDLRESPLVELCERLLGKGFELKIYDPTVSLSRLVGANREYVESHIPHLANLLAESPEEVMGHAEVFVVGESRPETIEALARANGRPIFDLVRLPDAESRRGGDEYHGVAW